MAVWRHYDQAGAEAQFTLDTVRDLEAIMARRLAASKAARARFLHRSGVAYGTAPGETLDIFPAGEGAPVVIYIHGGFWHMLDAATFSFVAAGFVPHGVAAVVIDYPLVPATDIAGIVRSCQSAIAWVHANARSFGADPARIHIAGNSAGGHLVAMLADRAWPGVRGLPADVVKSGCAISGLYELEPVRLTAQNKTLKLTPEQVAALSPLRAIPPSVSPLLCAVGGDETREFLDQNREFAAALRARGHLAEEMVVPGCNHVTVVLDAFADPAHTLNRAMRTAMGCA